MAKAKYYATTVVGKAVNVDNVEEFSASPFKVRGTSVKSYDEEGNATKIKNPSADDLANPDIRNFMTIDIEGLNDLLVLEVSVANRYGFQDVIDRKADGSFTLRDGATISRTGRTIQFGLN